LTGLIVKKITYNDWEPVLGKEQLMSSQPTLHRAWIVVGALLIQFSLGAIYAWSVFTKPLVDAGWSQAQTQIIFSAGLASFAIVMVLAGQALPKFGPRRLAISGGILLGLGYILAGWLDPTNFWVLFFGIGLIGGSGIGLVYVVPIAVGMRWFPDRKGLITGLAVAGFGFGAMIWVKLAGDWGALLADLGLGTTFIIYGLFFLLSVVLGGRWMVFPPEGWSPAGWDPATTKKNEAKGVPNLTSREMLHTPQFYMIFVTFLFSASAGLMSIGLMKLFPTQALVANGVEFEQACVFAGTAMAIFFSLANGLGRIGWGTISDKIGRKNALMIMAASQGLLMIAFPAMAGTVWLLYLAASLIGFNFGGNFALFPTITADIFGNKFVGQNYGWVFLSYGLGGIFGPILGGRLGDMGNFPLAFTIVGVLCLLAAAIIAALNAPSRSVRMVPIRV
jgi:OFA family oxalate/formate antiporter-like MFS transporter